MPRRRRVRLRILCMLTAPTTCGALRKGDAGKTVRLSGWVHRVRDHGGLLFIDLRDHYGLTQCVVDPACAGLCRRREGSRRMGDPRRWRSGDPRRAIP